MDNKEEIWRPVPGFEDTHQVSNFGRVKSIRTPTSYWGNDTALAEPHMLKGTVVASGARIFVLSSQKVKKMFSIQHLVASAFIPGYEDWMNVKFKDGDISNANLDNLIVEGYIENLPGEIWKDIEGYEDLYAVSNKGRVKSKLRLTTSFRYGKEVKSIQREKIRLDQIGKDGSHVLLLCKNGKYKTHTIHRLVADAFTPVDNSSRTIVIHRDGDKSNNCIENLERIKRSESYKPSKRRKGKPVICLDTNKVYDSIVLAAEDMNIPVKTLYEALYNGYKTHGYKFQYVESCSCEHPVKSAVKHNTSYRDQYVVFK